VIGADANGIELELWARKPDGSVTTSGTARFVVLPPSPGSAGFSPLRGEK
jgi:hypothetical protein